jgi:acyl-CoA synthetase (NDP forming)
LITSGFTGEIYPVHPQASEVQGVMAYPSVKQLPKTPDFAIVLVPATQVSRVLADLADIGTPIAQVVTAGFGETGEEGSRLQDELMEIVSNSDLRVLGPNCVGTFSASSRLTWTGRPSFLEGSTSLISQSGGLAYDVLLNADIAGVGIARVFTVGNAIDLNVADCVEFLASDPMTKVIGIYVEDSSNARRIFQTVDRISTRKPVVILKGGRSPAGAAAVASHTGAVAGDHRVWAAAMQQAGAVVCDGFDSFIASMLGVSAWNIKPVSRIALIGNGGGATVLSVDRCAELNWKVPRLADRDLRAIRDHFQTNGLRGHFDNPIDLPLTQIFSGDGHLLRLVLEELTASDSVDAAILNLNLAPLGERPNALEWLSNVCAALSTTQLGANPLAVVIRGEDSVEARGLIARPHEVFSRQLDIPTFRRLEDALDALSAVDAYARHQRNAAPQRGASGS